MNWQPIETAPKNEGEPLLLGYYSPGVKMLASSGYWTNFHGGGWVRWWSFVPTHWMPMPPDPETHR